LAVTLAVISAPSAQTPMKRACRQEVSQPSEIGLRAG
jgi:hypothetical protein